MTLENIIRLLDAGYTKEQIDALEPAAPASDPAPAPAPTPEPTPAPDEPKKGEGNADPVSVPAEGKGSDQEIAALKAQIEALTAAMQRNNIQNPPAPKADEIETEVDIMEKMLDRDLLI